MVDASLSRDSGGLTDRAAGSNRQCGQNSDRCGYRLVEPVSQQADITGLAVRMGIDIGLVNQQSRLAKYQEEDRQPV